MAVVLEGFDPLMWLASVDVVVVSTPLDLSHLLELLKLVLALDVFCQHAHYAEEDEHGIEQDRAQKDHFGIIPDYEGRSFDAPVASLARVNTTLISKGKELVVRVSHCAISIELTAAFNVLVFDLSADTL